MELAPSDLSKQELVAPLVLVVDDDPALRLVARHALEDAGFRVTEANDGDQVLRAAEESNPDIVLLDLVMPTLDGFTVCEQLRARPVFEHLPVLMITGLDDDESIDLAYERGATDFITKPINYNILVHRVRYMLRSQQNFAALRKSEARLTKAQRVARLGHWDWVVEADTFSASQEIEHIVGLDHEPIETYADFLGLIHPEDREQVQQNLAKCHSTEHAISIEHRLRLKDSTTRMVYQEVVSTYDATSQSMHISGVIQDLTERKQVEDRIYKIAHFDELTGLPNRRFLKRHLRFVVEQAKRLDRYIALLSVDIDRFNEIKHSLGHGASDTMLKAVAERIQDCLRASDCLTATDKQEALNEDTLARTEGDSFLVVLPELAKPEDAAIVANRINNHMAEPFKIAGLEAHLTVTMGITLFPENAEGPETLLKQADTALHQAKAHGPNNFQFFSESTNQQAHARLEMEHSLRYAIEREELELHYQPKVDLRDERTIGVEALLRWHHPQHGIVSPAHFIPIAEESGLIVPIGAWVLETACRQSKAWDLKGLPPFSVSVNLSGAQMRDSGLINAVETILKNTDLEPERLVLELTENMIMGDTETNLRIMRTLKSMGIRLSNDDFGTGYSSLSYLRRFPADELKVDRSMIKGIDTDEDAGALVDGIIKLAHSLRLRVVAEGAEKENQIKRLSDYNCDEVQGYWYSKPLPASVFTDWVTH